jgi:hypothetical protein
MVQTDTACNPDCQLPLPHHDVQVDRWQSNTNSQGPRRFRHTIPALCLTYDAKLLLRWPEQVDALCVRFKCEDQPPTIIPSPTTNTAWQRKGRLAIRSHHSPLSDCLRVRPYRQPIGSYKSHTPMTMPVGVPSRHMTADGMQAWGIRPQAVSAGGRRGAWQQGGQGQPAQHATKPAVLLMSS